MDVWFTLKVGKRAVSGTGEVGARILAYRECFLARVASRHRESIKKNESRELHRLLDRAIKEVNGTIEAANSVLV